MINQAISNFPSCRDELKCDPTFFLFFPSSSLPADFSQTNIRHIEISRTNLQSVDDETFQGLRLDSLKLNDNDLHEFSDRSFK